MCNEGYLSEDLFRFFINNGADVQLKNKQGKNVLHLLICSEMEIIKAKIQSEESEEEDYWDEDEEETEEEDDDSTHSLIDCFRLFIKSGAKVNTKTSSGETVLHLLCRNKYPSIFLLRFLIRRKVNVQSLNGEEENALHLLIRFCKSENLVHFIRLLVKAGIDVKAKTKDGSSAASLLWARRAEIKNVTGILQFLNSC